MPKGFFSNSQLQSKQRIPHIAHCGACGLHKTCLNPKMPFTGKGKKNILFVAEAPGRIEDKENTQLIGEAGQLFRNILRPLDFNLDRDATKTNALICRPPDNKIPSNKKSKMIAACRPNLFNTIRETEPNVIVLLGGIAAESFLKPIWGGDIGPIGRWAGWCIPCHEPNAWVIPTWHPSYLLRRRKDVVLRKLFKRHLKLAIAKAKSKPWKTIPDYNKEIEIILNPKRAAHIIKEMVRRGGPVSFDYEATCLKPEGEKAQIVSCSICWRGKKTISYPWQREAIDATSILLKSPMPKIAANIKFEDRWTREKLGHGVKGWLWDTMVASHVLDNRQGITSLNFQNLILLGVEPYDKQIKPFLKSKGHSRYNRIYELDIRDLLLYGGLDSRTEYDVAMKQMEIMRKRK